MDDTSISPSIYKLLSQLSVLLIYANLPNYFWVNLLRKAWTPQSLSVKTVSLSKKCLGQTVFGFCADSLLSHYGSENHSQSMETNQFYSKNSL